MHYELCTMYLPIEGPDSIEHGLATKLDVITKQYSQTTVTFHLGLVQHTAVKDSIVIVANSNVIGLCLDLAGKRELQ